MREERVDEGAEGEDEGEHGVGGGDGEEETEESGEQGVGLEERVRGRRREGREAEEVGVVDAEGLDDVDFDVFAEEH